MFSILLVICPKWHSIVYFSVHNKNGKNNSKCSEHKLNKRQEVEGLFGTSLKMAFKEWFWKTTFNCF